MRRFRNTAREPAGNNISHQLQVPSLVQHSYLQPPGGGRHLPDSAQPPHHLGLLPFTAGSVFTFKRFQGQRFLCTFTSLEREVAVRGGGRKGPKKKERAQMSIWARWAPGTRVGACLALCPVTQSNPILLGRKLSSERAQERWDMKPRVSMMPKPFSSVPRGPPAYP